MPYAQLNVRLDADLKRAGDMTLAQMGVTATDVIRSLWDYLAREHKLPEYAEKQDARSKEEPRTTLVAEGRGMAVRLAHEQGFSQTSALPDAQVSFEELRDLAFVELIDEGTYRV